MKYTRALGFALILILGLAAIAFIWPSTPSDDGPRNTLRRHRKLYFSLTAPWCRLAAWTAIAKIFLLRLRLA